MALLQDDKAIFYHPLNDSTETLKSQAWVGTGLFDTGKVSNALLSTDSFLFGAETEFLSTGLVLAISIAAISATKFVVAYNDVPDSLHGTAKVGTVSGTDITFGAEAEFNSAGSVTFTSIAILTVTKFVVVYRDATDSSHGTAKVGTVSGTDITFGAEAEFNSAGTVSFNSVTTLSTTSFVVAYNDGADLFHGTAKVGTVSGTDITFGAEAEFLSVGTASQISVAAISATQFVVVYSDAADSLHGTAKVGTVSGTDITFGAETEFLVAQAAFNSVAVLTATKFVVAYQDVGDSKHGTAKVGTVSGTDITFGAEAEFNSAGSVTFTSIAVLTATQFAVAYQDDADSDHGTVKVGTVSGTDITFGAEAEFLSAGSADDLAAAALSATSFAVVYRDGADSGHGTAKAMILASGASLTASTPAAYGTAAAATKLAFAGWLKNPSA